MTRTMRFETEDGRMLEAELFVTCQDRDGADVTWDIEWLAWQGTDETVALRTLSAKDQARFEREAQSEADYAAPDAYVDWLSTAADNDYDRMRDGD